jgi:hypothetical protein
VLSFESYDAIDAHWIMLAIHWKSHEGGGITQCFHENSEAINR